MQYDEGQVGRVFVLRLEDGDRLPECVERFAERKRIRAAACWLLGGLGPGTLVVGPEDGQARPPRAMQEPFEDPREVLAVGTLFAGPGGNPVLHMHAATGRGRETLTGCIRPGVDTWLVGEFLILEMENLRMARIPDASSGLALLGRSGE